MTVFEKKTKWGLYEKATSPKKNTTKNRPRFPFKN